MAVDPFYSHFFLYLIPATERMHPIFLQIGLFGRSLVLRKRMAVELFLPKRHQHIGSAGGHEVLRFILEIRVNGCIEVSGFEFSVLKMNYPFNLGAMFGVVTKVGFRLKLKS